MSKSVVVSIKISFKSNDTQETPKSYMLSPSEIVIDDQGVATVLVKKQGISLAPYTMPVEIKEQTLTLPAEPFPIKVTNEDGNEFEFNHIINETVWAEHIAAKA